ncbi:MAG: BspA family leucine-rich repeat surface protein, partial [Bacteroidales bacterium]|nr:BspA family leucine-rich repeat surface protein [Bacteroidales bacterium]
MIKIIEKILFGVLGLGYVLAVLAVLPLTIYVSWDKAYVVISEDGTTITFYYDTRILERQGTKYKYNKWCKWHPSQPLTSTFTKAVFDQSFKDARPTTCEYLFADCTELSTIEGIENLNTSEVEYMNRMFSNCLSLTSIDLSHFNTKKVKYMGCMFDGCENLTHLDLSSFDTREVRGMGGMFSRCKKLTQLDLSNFNTDEVRSLSEMFRGCSSLTSLDISGLHLSSSAEMSRMFFGCSKLKLIFANNSWEKLDVHDYYFEENTHEMFYGCDSLYGGQGTECVPYKDNGNYAHIDGGPHYPGYFSSKGPKPLVHEYTPPERQPYAVLENDVLT